MYKLIAIDLDGTLLNSHGEITENTKKILKKCSEKGIEIVLASGRPVDSIKVILDEIGCGRYFIAGNGALIYDIQEDKVIYENFLNKEKVLEIIKICEENSITYNVYEDKRKALKDYMTYGGMPYTLYLKTVEEKSEYLNNLFKNTYINDIVERNEIQREDILEATINMLSSSVGSLTNPKKLYDMFISGGYTDINRNTINAYLNYLQDAFLINKVERYNKKKKKYITTPAKYYFTDIGLRNARLNFRQQEEDHLMENIIYNELLVRGYNVDVGVIEKYEKDSNEKTIRKQLEVDFVCNQASKRYYIQSAFAIPNREKMEQEQKSLINIKDSFKKIIVVKDDINLWRNDEGILIISLEEFLLNKNSLDL